MSRISLAERFHWTLDYIDSLSLGELMIINGILEGQAEYEKQMSKNRAKGS